MGGTVSFAVLLFVFVALAQTSNIDRDKAEALITEKGGPGGCATFDECASFCDNTDNTEACLNYALENNLMSYDDVQRAKKFVAVGLEGPGGCNSEESCEAYCNIAGHMEECIEFAKENDLIPPGELEEAKKVLQAIRAGASPPGGCVKKEQCEAYCDDPAHIEECVEFGLAAGFISSEEAERIKKTGGKGPGGCKGKEQCDAYCQDPTHLEECTNFAVEHGFMSKEDAEMMKKTGGKGPGGCKSKEDCEVFCDNPDNTEECINFAVEQGFMPPEEAEQAKKFMKAGAQGPGGCKDKEECDAYCQNPEHGQECLEFGVKMGFIKPEEAEQMRNFVDVGGPGGCKTKEECEAFCQKPENQETCFNFGVQQGFIKPEEVENMKRGMEMMQQGGPGGCKSKEECETYCNNPDNQRECFDFVEQKGIVPPEQMREMREEVRDEVNMKMGGMPEELKECLRSALGEEFDKIERGEIVPGPEFGRFMSECAQKMQKPMGPPPEEGQPGPPEGMPQGPLEGYPEKPPEEMMPPEGMMPSNEGYPQSPEGYPKPPEEGFVPSPPEMPQPPEEYYPAPPPETQTPPPSEFTPPPSEPTEPIAPTESSEPTPPPESTPPPPSEETAPPPTTLLQKGTALILRIFNRIFR